VLPCISSSPSKGYIFSNITLNEGKIKPNYTLAFEFLTNWMPKVNKNFEQAKIGQNKRKTDDLASVYPKMFRMLKIVRTFFAACGGESKPRDLRLTRRKRARRVLWQFQTFL